MRLRTGRRHNGGRYSRLTQTRVEAQSVGAGTDSRERRIQHIVQAAILVAHEHVLRYGVKNRCVQVTAVGMVCRSRHVNRQAAARARVWLARRSGLWNVGSLVDLQTGWLEPDVPAVVHSSIKPLVSTITSPKLY